MIGTREGLFCFRLFGTSFLDQNLCWYLVSWYQFIFKSPIQLKLYLGSELHGWSHLSWNPWNQIWELEFGKIHECLFNSLNLTHEYSINQFERDLLSLIRWTSNLCSIWEMTLIKREVGVFFINYFNWWKKRKIINK